MIEAVIFDVDGTLIDTVDYHAKAWLWAFARHGHDIRGIGFITANARRVTTGGRLSQRFAKSVGDGESGFRHQVGRA